MTNNLINKTIIKALYGNTTQEQRTKAQQQATAEATTQEQRETIKRIFEALKKK